MKLRWVEREVSKSSGMAMGDYRKIDKVKVLQYWDAVDNSMQYGTWVDVPLEVEE